MYQFERVMSINLAFKAVLTCYYLVCLEEQLCITCHGQ